MTGIEEDPVIGHLFDTPEKKARWIYRFRLAYIAWICFVVFGIMFIAVWFVFLK